MATVDSRGVGSCLFEIGVNPENDRTTGNTETVGQGFLETLSQRRKELSVFKRFHPIVHGYTRAYAVDTGSRAFEYTQGP